MRRAVTALTCLLLGAPAFTQAQIILCKDEKGRTYTADHPIPECQGRELRHYGKSANVVRVVPAPPTPEERRQRQLEIQKKREIEQARQEQIRRDRAMLAAFSDEEAIIAEHEEAAAPIHEMIQHEKAALSRAQERRDHAFAQLAKAQESKGADATEWKQRAQAAELVVKSSASKLQSYQAQLAQLRSRYDAKIQRFRQLREEGEAKAPSS